MLKFIGIFSLCDPGIPTEYYVYSSIFVERPILVFAREEKSFSSQTNNSLIHIILSIHLNFEFIIGISYLSDNFNLTFSRELKLCKCFMMNCFKCISHFCLSLLIFYVIFKCPFSKCFRSLYLKERHVEIFVQN